MELFKLFGKIAVDNSDADRAIDNTVSNAEKSEPKLGKALKKIGAAVTAAFAVDKIKDFGQACVELSAEVSAEQSAFEQIMGDYSDTAQEKIDEIANATGMVNSRLTPYMTSMTAKFKGLGYDINDATDFAQQGLNIAADAAAFWDKSLEDSMSALNSFVNGSYEGGEAIGLFANDTQMAAYAVEKGLVSEAKEWANLEEKIKQATRLEYAENMQKASGAVGQAAKESGQYANVQANLNEKWRQFKAQIGEPILQNIVLPAMEKLSGFITDKLVPGLEQLKEKYVENQDKINALKDKFVDCGAYLKKTFSPTFSNLKDLFNNLKDKSTSFIEKILGLSKSGKTVIKVIDHLKNAIEFTAESTENASDITAKFVEWITGGSDGAERLKKIVLGVTAAFTTYKGIMSVTNKVLSTGKKIVDAYRNAQLFLNSTNPFGWAAMAVSAVAGLETVLRSFSGNPMDEITEKFSTLSKEEQLLVDKTGELSSAYDSLNDSWDSNSEKISQEYDGYTELAKKLDTMVDKNGLIKEGYEQQAETITGELSDALGMEIEIVDGVIQEYDGLQESIRKTIELKKAQAWLDANASNYQEALISQKDAVDNYLASEEALIEVNSRLYSAEAHLAELQDTKSKTVENLIASGGDYAEALSDQQAKVDGLKAKQLELQKNCEMSSDTLADYNTTIQNYDEVSTATLEGNVEKVNQALTRGLENFITAKTGTESTLKKQVESYKTEYENMKSAVERGNTLISQEDLKAKEKLLKQAKKELNDYVTTHNDKAMESGSKFAEGVKSKSSEAAAAGRALAQSGLDGANSIDYGAVGAQKGYEFKSAVAAAVNGAISLVNNSMSRLNVSVSGASGSIPKCATGGIVSRATIAQIGEDGAEAIVPLENNTEWIDKVAHKVTSSMGVTGSAEVVSKLNELIDTMKSRKIYLDSGALVGELAEGMDSALGSIGRMKRRGI